jgi:hypothetical protein
VEVDEWALLTKFRDMKANLSKLEEVRLLKEKLEK